MKKLDAHTNDMQNVMLVMPVTVPRDEAIEKKIDRLKVKMFGVTLGKFEVGNTRDVWIPYSLMTYAFLIDRKTIFNKTGSLNREGQLHFIFDYNEAHPFQYDIIDNGELKLKNIDCTKSGAVFLPQSVTDEEAHEKMEWHIQNRILRRIYSTNGKISLEKEKKFYRAAVEMEILYGANQHLRYAYLDDYGVDSEHILGLKYRIG